MRVLTFDPSGNFDEGKGSTGWAIFVDGKLHDFGEISAENFDTKEDYWASVGNTILFNRIDMVICESYRLYAGARGKSQINSSLETPQLIGFLRMLCWAENIEYNEQAPADKTPVNDERLVRAGTFTKKGNKHYCMDRPTNLHMRDAIRHGIRYYKFGKGKNAHGEQGDKIQLS